MTPWAVCWLWYVLAMSGDAGETAVEKFDLESIRVTGMVAAAAKAAWPKIFSRETRVMV